MRWRAGTRRAAALVTALLVGSAALAASAEAGTRPAAKSASVRPFVSGWMPYWATAESLDQVRSHPGLFTEVSPFWYALKKDGAGTRVLSHPLDSGTHASVVAALHAQRVRAVPTITDQTGAHVLAGLLAKPATRTAVVAALVRQAVADGVDGLDLDFEGFAFHDGRATWAALHPSWIAFVRELSGALARVHKVLDVTVPPIDSTGNSYWVYDPVAIAPYVHALRLMAYDYHFSVAGPLAPLPWVHDVVATTLAGVPAAKVFLGVPAYGRSWVTARTGSCPSGVDLTKQVVTPPQAAALAAASKVVPTWDAANGERTFAYTTSYPAGARTPSCTVTRTVWYDDARAIAARAKVAADAHLGGIAVWSIDDLPAATYAAMTPAFTTSRAPARTVVAAARTVPRPTASPVRSAVAATPAGAPDELVAADDGSVVDGMDVTPGPTSLDVDVAAAPATTDIALEPAAARSTAPWALPGLAAVVLLVVATTGLVVRRRAARAPTSGGSGRHAVPGGRHAAR